MSDWDTEIYFCCCFVILSDTTNQKPKYPCRLNIFLVSKSVLIQCYVSALSGLKDDLDLLSGKVRDFFP